MDPITFYWLTRLPYINTWVWVLLMAAVVAHIAMVCAYCCESDTRETVLKVARLTVPLQLALILAFILIPSDGEVAAMVELEQGRGKVVVAKNHAPGSSGLKADFSYNNATAPKSGER